MPDGSQNRGELWIVATPIGTLADLSARAAEVLGSVDIVLAEDTRRARALLGRVGISTRSPVQSLHEHNEDEQVERLLRELESGRSLALTSDAGTPVLSDPGFRLVRAARERGFAVRSVPGPSAFTAALAASGQPPLPATLCGFLPPRPGARRRRIAEVAACPSTLVFLLSPHRLGRELADLAEVLGGDRKATLLAEISKRFERATTATLGELARGEECGTPRGEYVVVVAPAAASDDGGVDEDEVRSEYRLALEEGLGRADAMRRAARRLGLRRRQVFDLLSGDGERRDSTEDG